MNDSGVRRQDLDCYRAVAILGVVTVHCSQQILKDFPQFYDAVPAFFLKIPGNGANGLFLFFILSGYLIEELYGLRISNFSAKKFLKSRLARIFPLWFIIFLVGALQFFVLNNGPWVNASIEKDFWNLVGITFLSLNFSLFLSPKLWNTIVYGGASVQTEMQFYILFPILRRISNRFLWLLSFPIFLFDIFFDYKEQHDVRGVPLQLVGILERSGLLIYLPYFLLGIFLSRFSISKCNLIALSIWLIFVRPTRISETISAICFFSFAYILNKIQIRFNLALRLSKNISTTSYFIFFAHFQILMIINFFNIEVLSSKVSGSVSSFIFLLLLYSYVVIFLSVQIGKISWKYFELPFIKLGKREWGKGENL